MKALIESLIGDHARRVYKWHDRAWPDFGKTIDITTLLIEDLMVYIYTLYLWIGPIFTNSYYGVKLYDSADKLVIVLIMWQKMVFLQWTELIGKFMLSMLGESNFHKNRGGQ